MILSSRLGFECVDNLRFVCELVRLDIVSKINRETIVQSGNPFKWSAVRFGLLKLTPVFIRKIRMFKVKKFHTE